MTFPPIAARSIRRTGALPVVVFAAIACFASAARAQDASLAQQRFERGVQLFEAHDHQQALAEFNRSLELYASPNTRLYVARCLRELGRVAEAYGEYQRVAREAADLAATSPRYRMTVETAQAEFRALEPRVGRVTVAVDPVPAGARLRLGTRVLPAAAIGSAIPVDPGELTVRIEADGYAPAEASIHVAGGDAREVRLVLHASVAVASSARPVAVAPQRAVASGSLAPSIAAWSVGVAGGVVFGVLQSMAQSNFEQVRSCSPNTCPPGVTDLIDTGRAMEVGSFVGLGVAIAGLGAGVVLLVTRPRAHGTSSVGVSVTPTSAGVAWHF